MLSKPMNSHTFFFHKEMEMTLNSTLLPLGLSFGIAHIMLFNDPYLKFMGGEIFDSIFTVIVFLYAPIHP